MSRLLSEISLSKYSIQINGIDTVLWRGGNSASSLRLLLLHGITGSHSGLMPLAAQLQDYDLILPDLPGHGLSSMPQEKTVDFLCDWLKELVKYLTKEGDNSSLSIIAHSMAGRLAAGVFLDLKPALPIKSLMLLNPVPDLAFFMLSLRELTSTLPFKPRQILLENILAQETRLRYLLVRKSKINFKLMRNMYQNSNNKLSNFIFYQEIDRQIAQDKFFVDHAVTSKKAFCIVGEKDNLVAKDSKSILGRLFGKDKLLVCQNTGHLMPIEAPLDTAKIIKKLL